MHTRIINVHIKNTYLDHFLEVTKENLDLSRQESGIIRFECLQNKKDPLSFTFIEVFKSPEDRLAHFATEHFKKWNNETKDMFDRDLTSDEVEFL